MSENLQKTALTIPGATELSATFADQGLKIRVRKDPRRECRSVSVEYELTLSQNAANYQNQSESPVGTTRNPKRAGRYRSVQEVHRRAPRCLYSPNTKDTPTQCTIHMSIHLARIRQ